MGISINRRLFLIGWIFQHRVAAPLQVEVMEVFLASDGPCAILVHHANEATRDDFSRWIRANSGARVACRFPNGTFADGRIFRISLCFGRGLILTRSGVSARPKDILSILQQ